jgi:chloramphenicol 3-O phosphotransferase
MDGVDPQSSAATAGEPEKTAVTTGTIIVLNGVPRSGKSSIVREIQDSFEGVWMNLGVDVFCRAVTPVRFNPGIGLQPGGPRPDIEALIPGLYGALYDSIAAHSRHGLNVVADMDHHDGYSRPLGVLADAARRLDGLRAWFVGVRCPPSVIVERRVATWGEKRPANGTIPEHILRWEAEVHRPGIYDLEVDTSAMRPAECAAAVRDLLGSGVRPTAFAALAASR